ncbi:hypothetical protein [Acinetobacter bereziniae]|uniref:hypothetical protein n=1 Tax=Acinetobacter bereziniae TaxID=106648 RepID=UPI003009C599
MNTKRPYVRIDYLEAEKIQMYLEMHLKYLNELKTFGEDVHVGIFDVQRLITLIQRSQRIS